MNYKPKTIQHTPPSKEEKAMNEIKRKYADVRTDLPAGLVGAHSTRITLPGTYTLKFSRCADTNPKNQDCVLYFTIPETEKWVSFKVNTALVQTNADYAMLTKELVHYATSGQKFQATVKITDQGYARIAHVGEDPATTAKRETHRQTTEVRAKIEKDRELLNLSSAAAASAREDKPTEFWDRNRQEFDEWIESLN